MAAENSENPSTPSKPAPSAAQSGFAETTGALPDTSVEAQRVGGGSGTAQIWVGKTLGKYRIISVLGQGAMGVVLKARDSMIERDVAIKVLADHLATDATALGRFLAEAKAAGRLNHPNVMAIYEICQEGPTSYLVLEYVPGGSLEDRLAERRALPVLEATQALIDACKGVGAAHAAGLIHRDIKPANFMRAADGSIKVADFGLAKAAGGASRQFTQTGMVVGTPFFMSPEQCEARPVDRRSDIYSLGATYYSLLTGENPFQGSDSVPQLMYAHCHGPVPNPKSINPAIPDACSRIIAFAMAKAPADRYQSAPEMLADLQALAAALSGQTPIGLPSESAIRRAAGAAAPPAPTAPRGRKLPWAVAGLSLLGLLMAAVFLWRPWQPSPKEVAGAGALNKPALTATAPGVTAADITLGLSAPFSGPAKELGRGMQVGIETYLRHINDSAGGIHGRKLKLLALDDGYDPKRCAETMKDMIERRPVFAFIGNVGTPTAEVSVPIVLQHKRVLFGAFTGAGLLRRDPPDRYVFNYRASYAEETAAIVHYLLTVRNIMPDQIAVFAQQDGYGDAGFNGVAKALRKVGFDTERILRVGYERNTTNVDGAVTELLKHKDRVKAVVMVPTYGPAAAFIKRVRDAGMSPIFTNVSFAGSNALAEALKETAPKFVEGVIVTQVVPFYGSSATGVLQFRERLAQYYPAEQPNFISLEGYIAAKLFCTALEKAGTELTTDKLVEAIESIRNLDFGLGAQISFGPSEHQGSHKVWAAVLDGNGQFQNLELD
ncbi:MAG TPA: ABC transporter substrate-binding protein [Gemmataceae bacterium]|nr:ABC transporter substrate-binding protein [Gemmataceae bacterium]